MNREEKIQKLKESLKHAPASAGTKAEGLRGWESGDIRICVECAGRLMAHGSWGYYFGKDGAPIWEPSGVNCDLCPKSEKGEKQ